MNCKSQGTADFAQLKRFRSRFITIHNKECHSLGHISSPCDLSRTLANAGDSQGEEKGRNDRRNVLDLS